jgi:hypothetical protein
MFVGREDVVVRWTWLGELLLDVPGMGELSMVGTIGSPSVFLDTDLRHRLRLRVLTVKEAHAAPPPPLNVPFSQRETLMHKKACQMALI